MANVKISQIANEVTTPTDDMLIEVEENDGTSGKMRRDNFLSGSFDVVADTTPQLGGNLDVNGKSIVSVSNGNILLSPNGSGKIRLGDIFWPTADGTTGQVPVTDGSGNLTFSDAINLAHATFDEASETYDSTTDSGLHAQVDVSDNAVDIEFPNTAGIPDGTQIWLRVNSSDNAASISVATSGQLRSRNFLSSHDHEADQVFIGLSQATQEGSWVKVWKESSIWQAAGLLRENETDDLNIFLPPNLEVIAAADIDTLNDIVTVWDDSASVWKQIDFFELYDLEVSQPSSNFSISASTAAKTLVAPTGGSTCTIEQMRVGQVVPFRNVSGGTYTFAEGTGVTITGDTTVADTKAAAIEAISAVSIFITAES